MNVTGILPLIKPKGMTSHDCVFRLRKLFNTKKVGHTGTLDPDVTGVLPICFGRATKIAEYMTDYPKTYIGEVTLGFATTTEDSSGEVVEERKVDTEIPYSKVQSVIDEFKGEIIQIPPMYSAVKVNGKRLYQYAREGKEVERPQRKVTIHNLTLLSNKLNYSNDNASFSFEVHCSKGTYVRTLAVDIGKKLGFPAHMSDLKRIASGPFTIDECFTFEEIEQALENGKEKELLLTIEEAVSHFEKVTVSRELEEKIKNGAVLPLIKGIEESRFSVYNEEGVCIAIYIKHPTKEGLMKPEKMLQIE
ncbi:tRNA pseudouridine(55) synthase TruB [Bacillus sp. FJAT-45350]|uniref:tRNA pseudouridine(55) synthase TruB n=1 Tax=Bacillus sp. FJAT-45350 TaxID=2011014 RepID=UPI000BB7634B|nr:tRNA pseudouridine(55) synthase TruB [Bacillus sp. FJAT-45350]